jgi:hypothetical protein
VKVLRTGRENMSCQGVGTQGKRKDIRKGCRKMNKVEMLCYVHMYLNAKINKIKPKSEVRPLRSSEVRTQQS